MKIVDRNAFLPYDAFILRQQQKTDLDCRRQVLLGSSKIFFYE